MSHRTRCLSWIALALVLAASSGSVPAFDRTFAADKTEKSDKAAPFFNGKDFDGWEGRLEFWSVKDGVLTGSTPKGLGFNTFLCSKKQYGDFELKFQVKMTPKATANSGVQIRSKIENMKEFAVTGPQCDMGQQFWGSLYGENFGGMMKEADAKLVKKVLKQEDWNDYYIKAVGKHITIKLNGETTVDGDFEKAPSAGIIAWQIHAGPPMEVSFRNITFTDLTEKK